MKYLKIFESFEDIDSICKKYGIKNYTINSDGSVDVDGDVDFYRKGFTKLPLKFGRVSGSFDCTSNQLTTLEGAPREVGEGVSFSGNQLTTLEGAPERVSGGFNCSRNKLTTLEGCPEEIGGGFFCYENQLTTLNGGPKRVSEDFNCRHNKLTTLEGAPREVGRDFDCRYNQLTTLEGAPEKVGGSFDCEHNQLKTLKGAPEMIGNNFYYEDNPIYVIIDLFKNEKNFMDSLDWNYIRKNKETNQYQIVLSIFKDACEEAGIEVPKSITGYKYI